MDAARRGRRVMEGLTYYRFEFRDGGSSVGTAFSRVRESRVSGRATRSLGVVSKEDPFTDLFQDYFVTPKWVVSSSRKVSLDCGMAGIGGWFSSGIMHFCLFTAMHRENADCDFVASGKWRHAGRVKSRPGHRARTKAFTACLGQLQPVMDNVITMHREISRGMRMVH
ncbi:MAG: hypothetical protein M1820_000165 [Bogoriella megaspora]|nr:MAG: hypothetical protein M1820_000165 [Bogoriella megaspora]